MGAALLAQAAGPAAGATTEVVLFVVFAGLAIGSGIAMVAMRNVVHGALMLVVNLLSIAGLYLVLETAFLSVVQIIVYAGAIMVLFLFVIMLLGVHRDDLLVDVRPSVRVAAILGALAVVAFVGYGLVGPYTSAASICPGQDGSAPAAPEPGTVACVGFADTLATMEAEGAGSVEVVAGPMFSRYTFPFEAAALLLTVATLGAMLLGRRSDPDPDDDPAWVPSVDVPDAGADHGEPAVDDATADERAGDPVADDALVSAPVGAGERRDETSGDADTTDATGTTGDADGAETGKDA